MTRRLCAALTVLLLAAGCGDGGAGAVRIDADDAGASVTVSRTGTLELQLEANPTTGYQWVVLDPGLVELTTESYEPESDLAGAGGVTTFCFTPTGAGTAPLRLGYLRPWEDGVAPIDEYVITVEVTE